MNQFLALLSLLVLVTFALAAPSKNDFLVRNLPGLKEQPSFNMYAGNMPISNEKSLFFTLVEAESSPEKAPLVLWQSGGKLMKIHNGRMIGMGQSPQTILG